MKKLFLCLSLIGWSLVSFSQQKLNAMDEVKEVTIYANGAQVQNQFKVLVPQGSSELIVGNVAQDLDIQNIQVKGPDYVSVLSIVKTMSADGPIVNPEQRKLNDTLNALTLEREMMSNKLQAAQGALEILTNKNILGGADGGKVAINDLAKLVEYYQIESVRLNTGISNYNKGLLKLDKRIAACKESLRAFTGTGGQLKLSLNSTKAGSVPFEIRYMTHAASWHIYYDIKASSLAAPLQLLYKAEVSQNTGVDWRNVKLSLSTNDPAVGGVAPELSPSYTLLRNPKDNVFGGFMAQNRTGGMRPVQLKLASAEVMAEAASNDEVARPLASMAEKQLSRVFDIAVPYTVASNGQPHSVTLHEYTQPVTYNYVAVPKLDKDVFLVGEITDFEKLNLIPGEANISFENMFVGKSIVNPTVTSDTLKLSMGRDKGIVVKRERKMDSKSKSTSGSTVKQTYTYEIEVRNNKSNAVNLVVKDQYPISTDKAVQVDLIDSGDAFVNAETGLLTWAVALKPGESRTYRFTFSTKHPKDQQLLFN